MNKIIENTEFYIWNENGLFIPEDINSFCHEFNKKSMFDFSLELKDMYIYFSLSDNYDLNVKFYNNGYLIFIEGRILNTILFLYEFDRFYNQSKEIFISPTQRLEKDTEFLFTRGAKIKEISLFLDKIFNNKDYSSKLSQ